jgi:hypothetical protein
MEGRKVSDANALVSRNWILLVPSQDPVSDGGNECVELDASRLEQLQLPAGSTAQDSISTGAIAAVTYCGDGGV